MSSSLIPNLRKDLTRQLKTVFAADSPSTFPSLSPPASLLDLVEQYLSASKDASLSRSTTASASKDAQASAKEVFVEHQKLVDLLIETSIALPKTPSKLRRPGRISAWLIVLERLCTVHASDDTAADESQLVQKEQITTLWPALLRKVLLPSTGEGMHFTMGREGLAAAKSILAWSFKGKPDSGSAADLGKFESGIMAEYAALAVRPLVPQKQEDAKTKEKEIRDMQDVLCSLGHMRPKTFFAYFASNLPSQPQNRSALLMLLAHFLRKHANLSHHTLPVQLFDQLLLCILLEQDAHLVQLGVASLLILLPRIPSHLGPYIPLLFAVYAKLVAMSRSASQIHMPDVDPSPNADRDPKLKADVNFTFSIPQEEQKEVLLVREVFTYLYGLLPCNLMAFLKSPVEYFKGFEWNAPFAKEWDEPTLDLKAVGLFSESYLQLHALQPQLISSTPEREVSDLKTRWSRSEAAAVIYDCEKQYIVPLSTPQPNHRRSGSGNINWPMTRQSSYSHHDEIPERSASPSSTHSDLVHPVLQRVNALSQETSSLAQAQAFKNPSSMQREIELLRAELNYEQYLKTQHHQHMGILHRQKVLESGFEAERQTLVQFNKHLRAQLSEKQSALDKVREEMALSRRAHIRWETEYKTRLKNLKEEKRSWGSEKDNVKASLAEGKLVVGRQGEELEMLGSRVFDLEAQIENEKPKIAKLGHYEAWIDKLSQNLVKWDEDLLKYHEQEAQMDALLSALRKANQLEESSEREANELRARLRSQAEQIASFERQVETLNKKIRTHGNEKKLPLSQPTVSYDVLRKEYLRARSRCIELEEEKRTSVGDASKRHVHTP